MTRRTVAVLAIALLSLVLGGSGMAGTTPTTTIELRVGETAVMVNGEPASIDSAAVIPEGESRTYVPVRFIAERLGAYVGWDGSEQKVTYLTGDQRIELWIGKREARVNGSDVTLDAAPFVDGNGRTQVPVRFVSEQLGATVEWEGSMRMVTIRAPWAGRVVLIRDNRFSPSLLNVPAGTRVTWVNLDPVVHNVVAEDWHSELIAYERAYTRTLTKATKYSCMVHANMGGQIQVR
ncbi:MAG: hypothetical protein JWN15_4267 [Firmicutes bacterium]|nr:hypothetical protein [Bacillota bacterium]